MAKHVGLVAMQVSSATADMVDHYAKTWNLNSHDVVRLALSAFYMAIEGSTPIDRDAALKMLDMAREHSLRERDARYGGLVIARSLP